MKNKGKFLSLLFLSAGLFALIQVILPVVSFKLLELKLLKSDTILVSPLNKSQVLGVSIKNDLQFPAFYSVVQRQTPVSFVRFDLSVPSIDLNKIAVYVDSNDLSMGLIHLSGSALPGEKGNVFISGHSAIPLVAKGVKAYFDKLPEVKRNDAIFISAAGVLYTYKVTDIKVVDPKDTSVILPPDTQGRYVTLMTCVPPGLNTKRLVVIGKLI